MTRIVAAIPGRIRIRDGGLRQPDRQDRLHLALAALPGVLSCRGNPVTGSVVVHYDAARVPAARMETLVEQAVDAELALPRDKAAIGRRLRINRIAKYGMLGSLGASLALAAAGNKRWHAATGIVFVACLGVHLATHRRQLLR
ncbi:MAG: cation transporter [Rhodocyclales bacterium]|nr:cation transporter [Rhodocyclales bacterium]